MNWKIVLVLSLLGVLIGIGNVFGLIMGIEWLVWLVAAVITAFVIEKTCSKLFVTQGFLTGFLQALFQGLVTAIFYQTYLAHNLEVLDEISKMPADIAPEFYIIIASVLIGLVYGLFIGLVVFIIRKLSKKNPPAVQEG